MPIQKQDAYERNTSNRVRKAILFDAIKVGATFMGKEMQGKEFPLPHGHFLAIA